MTHTNGSLSKMQRISVLVKVKGEFLNSRTIKNFIYKIKYQLHAFIAKRPWLLITFYRYRRKYKMLVVNNNTDIVIEGFPRSANTFAVLAFQSAQVENTVVAHHLHAEAQFILAKKYNVPAIALLREPIEAISSLINRDKHIDIVQGIQRYIDFYRLVLQMKDNIVIANFTTVVTDFSQVITLCNYKFNCNFELPNDTEKEKIKIFSKISKLNYSEENGDLSMIAIPHKSKDFMKVSSRSKVQECTLLLEAQAIFNELSKYSH